MATTRPSQQPSGQQRVSGQLLNKPLDVVREEFRLLEQHNFDSARSILSSDFQFTGVTPTPVDRDGFIDLHKE